ncbi:hypothetical protein [Candidatus Alkanophaga liquidiphilum]
MEALAYIHIYDSNCPFKELDLLNPFGGAYRVARCDLRGCCVSAHELLRAVQCVGM